MSKSSVPSYRLEGSYVPLHEQLASKRKAFSTANASQKELELTKHLYRMEKLMIDGPYWPADEIRRHLFPREGERLRILDVGIGCDDWAYDMAIEFPHVEILSLITDPTQQRRNDMPPNCRSELLNIAYDDISHLIGKFDLVHCRRVWRLVEYYVPILRKIVGVLKPGGLFFHVEGDRSLYDEHGRLHTPAFSSSDPGTGSWLARFWLEVSNRILLSVDIPSGIVEENVLNWFTSDERLEEIRTNSIITPIGWPGRPQDGLRNGGETGRMAKDALYQRIAFSCPRLLASGMPLEELNLILQECETDFSEMRIKCSTRWHFSIARLRRD